MTIDAKGRLDLRHGEELAVRLTTTGAIFADQGRLQRLVGRKRGYHYLRSMGRAVDCAWLNCRYCDRGMRRQVKYETQLLWEGLSGLEVHTAFLAFREHGQFAKAAEVIERQGRDPTEVRLLWRYQPGTARKVQVLFL